jgi:predicted membrane protein
MRLRGSLFWGIVLIVLAIFLLARQMGWITGNIFDFFWPAIAVLFGVWLLIGALGRGRGREERYNLAIPRENAAWARVKFDHGAGRLNIHGGAGDTDALSGVFGTEVDHRSKLDGDRLDIRLRNSHQFWAWYPGQSLDWDVSLNKEILYNLKIDSGASATVLDLTDLKVTNLEVDTGASSTEVSLPANAGTTLVDIDSGAASVKVSVPAGVGARIRVKSGVASVNVDTNRFRRIDNGQYQSDEYDTSANRADITIDAGVGTIEVK